MSISLFRSLAGQYEHLREVNTVSMMNTISHHIEDQVINHRLPVEFFAGFQRFSLFPAQLRRYQKLGAVCRRVYVFGVPDTRPPAIPGIEYISIDPSSPLAKEWFVVVDTPEFWTVLATQEVDGRDVITGGRAFDGLWTYDAEVVDRASLLLSQTLDNFYKPIKDRDFESQNLHITEISNRMVTDLERNRIKRNRWRSRVNSLQHTSETLAKTGDMQQLMQRTANVLHSIFGASGVIINVFDQNKQLRIMASEGETNVNGNHIHAGQGPAVQAIQQTAMVHIADTRNGYERDPHLPTAQALVAVPIVGHGGVYGSIVIGGSQAGMWSQEDGETLKAVCAMLAVGLERSGSSSEQLAASNNQVNTEQWQAPMAYLLTLHQKMRTEGPISPNQQAVLEQIDRLATGLAYAIGVPEPTIRRIMNQ